MTLTFGLRRRRRVAAISPVDLFDLGTRVAVEQDEPLVCGQQEETIEHTIVREARE